MAVLAVATSVQQSSLRAPTVTAWKLPRLHAVRKTSEHHLGQGCSRQDPGQRLGIAEGQRRHRSSLNLALTLDNTYELLWHSGR